MTYLPAVRHAGLTHEGVDKRALQLQFERPLEGLEQMAILAEVGFFHVSNGTALLPEFSGTSMDTVLLRAASGQKLVDGDYTAAARHFGFEPDNGHLTFIMDDDSYRLVSEIPLMPQ